jgi:tetratricopeptide (TPR) repeat protein
MAIQLSGFNPNRDASHQLRRFFVVVCFAFCRGEMSERSERISFRYRSTSLRNLDYYRRQARLDIVREQVSSVAAITVTVLFVINIIAVWFPHLIPLSNANFWIRIGMGLVIPVIAFVAFVAKFIKKGKSKFLSELANWLLFALVLPVAWIIPNFAVLLLALLVSEYSFAGRFGMARSVYAFGGFIYWRLSPMLMNLLRVDRAEIDFYQGDVTQAIGLARTAAESAKRLYQQQKDAGSLNCLAIVQSLYARYLALHGLRDDAVPLINELIGLTPELNSLGGAHKAQSFSYIAYAATSTKQFDIALEYSVMANAAYEASTQKSPALTACIAEHWATAALANDDLDLAERKARESIAAWESIIRKTGMRLAEPHRVLGTVLMARGDQEAASEELALARAIVQMRAPAFDELTAIDSEQHRKLR